MVNDIIFAFDMHPYEYLENICLRL